MRLIHSTFVAASTAMGLLILPATVSAQDSSRTIFQTDDGRVFTRDIDRRGQLGNREGAVTWTGPRGTTNRSFRRFYDPDTRTWNRSRTVTGPRGRSATVDSRLQCANGACERNFQRRGYDGRTSFGTGRFRKTGPGAFEGTRSITGPRGRERRLRWQRLRN